MAKELVVRIIGDPSSLNKAFASAGAGAKTFGARMQSVGHSMVRTGAIMTAATIPLMRFGKESFDVSREFEESMTRIETQAGAPAGEIKNLRQSVIDLGKEGTHGPKDLAEALFFVESAGFRGKKALDVLKLAEQGATVGGSDLAQTTSALAAALKTKARGAENATAAMGALNAIVGQGQLHMEDLVSALSTGVIPVFKETGLGIEDFGAALAIQTARGVPAAKAATALRMAVLRIAAPVKNALKGLEELGLGQFDLAKALRSEGGLPAAIDLLRTHYENLVKKMGKEKALSVLASVFPKQSLPTILSLIGASDELGKKFDAIGEHAKDFPHAVEQAMEDSGAKTKKFHATIQALQITVGDILTPILLRMADIIAQGAAAFEKLSPSVQKIIVTIAAVVTIAGPLMLILGGIIELVVTLGSAFAILLSPVGLVVVAIAALVAAMVAAVLWPDKLKQALMRFGVSAKDAETIVKTLRAVFETIKPVLQVMEEAFRGLAQVVKGVVNIIMGLLQGDFSRVWTGVKQVWHGAIQFLIAEFVKLPAILLGIAVKIGVAIIGGIGKELMKLRPKVMEWLSELPAILADIAAKAPGWAKDIGIAIVKGIGEGILSLSGWLEDQAGALVSRVKDKLEFWHSPPDAYGKHIGGLLTSGLADGITEGTATVAKAASDMVQKAKEAVESARGDFNNAFSTLASEALGAFDAAVQQWQPKAQIRLDKLHAKEQMAQLKSDITQAAEGVQEANTALQTALAGGDPEEIKQAQQQVTDALAQQLSARRALRDYNLEQDAARQQEAHDKETARERIHFENQLAALQQAYGNQEITTKQFHQRLNKLLAQHGVDQEFYGTAVGIQFAAGIAKSTNAVVAAIMKLLKRIEKLMKLHSPAEEGPLADLDKWWAPFASTLLGGVDLSEFKKFGTDVGSAVSGSLSGTTTSFAPGLRDWLKGVTDAAPGMAGALDDVGKSKDALGENVKTFSEQASANFDTVTSSVDKVGASASTLSGIGRILETVTKDSVDPLATLAASFDVVTEAMKAVRFHAYELRDGLRDTIGEIGTLLGGASLASLRGLAGRAGGGSVSAGTAYTVGESGPELFIPRSSGTIIPNGASGGGTNVQVTITGTVLGANANAVAESLADSIHDALLRKQRRTGALGIS